MIHDAARKNRPRIVEQLHAVDDAESSQIRCRDENRFAGRPAAAPGRTFKSRVRVRTAKRRAEPQIWKLEIVGVASMTSGFGEAIRPWR